jgi:hypothetical protein
MAAWNNYSIRFLSGLGSSGTFFVWIQSFRLQCFARRRNCRPPATIAFRAGQAGVAMRAGPIKQKKHQKTSNFQIFAVFINQIYALFKIKINIFFKKMK